VSPLPSRALEALFVRDAAGIFSGTLDVAEDGFIYSLPAGSDAIDRKRGL
jgi:hypothetical protein